VLLLSLVELKRSAYRQQHIVRGIDLPALLKPGVPGERHAGEQSNFFAA
jgi:hypothetical protein